MYSDMEKLVELLKDEATAKELLTLPTAKAAQEELKRRGLDCTEEELTSFMNGIKASLNEGEELNEESLSTVVGGASKNMNYDLGKKCGRFLRTIWDTFKGFATGLW